MPLMKNVSLTFQNSVVILKAFPFTGCNNSLQPASNTPPIKHPAYIGINYQSNWYKQFDYIYTFTHAIYSKTIMTDYYL